MLRKILAVTGRPGLFEIVSQGKNMIIVEELATGHRLPVHSREKVVSLGDIAMYTDSGDKPLGEILDAVYARNEGKLIDVKGLIADGKLRDEFEAVIPDFDKDRVFDSDIKKLFTWYNALIAKGYTRFANEEPEAEEPSTEDKN